MCVEALVVDFKPLGFCFLMGMNGIVALGGVSISATQDIYFMEKNGRSGQNVPTHRRSKTRKS